MKRKYEKAKAASPQRKAAFAFKNTEGTYF